MDNSINDTPKGFELPNHTQTPNSLFDYWLERIDTLAELKVTLAIIRKTFGWHKQEDTISITQLIKATGLSRQGVIDGLEAGLQRGLIVRRPAKRNGFCYGLRLVNDLDQSKVLTSLKIRLEPVNSLDQSLVNSLDPQKKDINKLTKETKGGEGTPPPPTENKTENNFSDNPAIQAYKQTYPEMQLTPDQALAIVSRIKNFATWRAVLADWQLNNYKPGNIANMLDRYQKEVSNDSGKSANTRTGHLGRNGTNPAIPPAPGPTLNGKPVSKFDPEYQRQELRRLRALG